MYLRSLCFLLFKSSAQFSRTGEAAVEIATSYEFPSAACASVLSVSSCSNPLHNSVEREKRRSRLRHLTNSLRQHVPPFSLFPPVQNLLPIETYRVIDPPVSLRPNIVQTKANQRPNERAAMNELFQKLAADFESGGIAATLATAEQQLRKEKRFHELFEILKMRDRQQQGLPLLHRDDVKTTESQQRQLEDGLIKACNDVGFALLDDGQIQESWVYLRHLNDSDAVLEKLRAVKANEENLDQLLGLLLYEGLDPAAGYAMVLEHYGTCNAITTMQQTMYGRPREQRQATGQLLVAHVHNELLENVKSHVQREENESPGENRLVAVMAKRDYLFADGAYHIDTSHLSSTIQIATELTDSESVELALDMARYGEKLDEGLRYPGDPPFEDLYPTSAKFFAAQLGQDVDESVAHFRKRAEETDAHQEGTFAIETYIDLLSRVGKPTEAMQATVELIPQGIQTTGRAPSFYDLSEQMKSFDRYRELCAERDDLLGYVISLGK